MFAQGSTDVRLLCLAALSLTSFLFFRLSSFSSQIFWGNFEVGKVYLGCSGGNRFSILLRSLQIASVSDSSEGSSGGESAVDSPSSSAFAPCLGPSSSSPLVDAPHQPGGGFLRQAANKHEGKEKEESKEEKKKNEEKALIDYVKNAAALITRRGFINYFGYVCVLLSSFLASFFSSSLSFSCRYVHSAT